MNKLSALAENLIGSEIVKLGNSISDRIRQGAKIYNYTIGDVDPAIFPIPAAYEAAIIQAYQDHYTNYPPADGLAALRDSVAYFVRKHQGLNYAPDEIQIASGGRPLIYSLFRTLVNPGDKVIYAVPSWNNNHYVMMNEGAHCAVEALPENNFMPTAAAIEPFLKDAVLLCLCTPQNPTGTTLSREALEAICDLVLAENARRGEDVRKLYVMYDQIYSLLTYGGVQHYNPVSLRPAMKEYTLFIDGVSKAFAATGVRVGWSMGPAKVIGKMRALLSHVGAWAPMAEQQATAVFLKQDAEVDQYLRHYRQALSDRLSRFYEGFIALKDKGYPVDVIAPQAAIYLTIKIDLARRGGLTDQEAVTAYLLDEAQLAVVPFYAFGADRQSPWYRLSVGTCLIDDIPLVLAALERALGKIG